MKSNPSEHDKSAPPVARAGGVEGAENPDLASKDSDIHELKKNEQAAGPAQAAPAPALAPSGELIALDAAISAARGQRQGDPRELVKLHGRRAKKRLEFGFSLGALADMTSVYDLRASTVKKSTYQEDARFAEVLRVHARDRLLSTKDAADFRATVDRSIELFLGARDKAKRDGAKNAELAWITAHLGAAYTMKYWIAITQQPDDAADGKLDRREFADAKRAFDDALELKEDYPWAERFRSFLYALRGKPESDKRTKSDFANAIAGLTKLIEAGNGEQASLKRSLSMLLSYVAVQSQDPSAAEDSIKAGLEAMALDSEEFHAPHSVAASIWYLAKFGPEATRPQYDAQLTAAIDSARVRTKNIVSQASAVLASLALIEGIAEQSPTKAEQAIGEAKQILENFAGMGIPLDLESSAMTIRSPAVAIVRQWASDAKSQYYDRSQRVRAELKPIIHELRAKLF